MGGGGQYPPPRQGSAWGDGQGRAPPTQGTPTPRLARNFFIKAPSPYAAPGFGVGSRRTRAARNAKL
jgi:hypothetical protein